ncbi:MAG: hypothetical protein DRP63_03575 [Planctomycetota bacterium]|nr:MAG: hypothetical protein DRP63_03575 [Planctomycetota bacterium]
MNKELFCAVPYRWDVKETAMRWFTLAAVGFAGILLFAQQQQAPKVKPLLQRLDLGDCVACRYNIRKRRSADKPAKRFEGLFAAGSKCPLCQGTGRLYGYINWKEKFFEAFGIGVSAAKREVVAKLRAREAARKKAAANALLLAAKVRLTPLKDDVQVPNYTRIVEGIVQNADYKVVREGRGADRQKISWWAVVRVRVPLVGVKGLSGAVYKAVRDAYYKQLGLSVKELQARKWDGETIVVVDARKVPAAQLRPALFPTLVGADGNRIYDVGTLAEEAGKKNGGAEYAVLEDEELSFDELRKRLGAAGEAGSSLFLPNPNYISNGDSDKKSPRKRKKRRYVVVKADEGAENATAKVSAEDAKKLMETEKKTGALSNGKVIIIVNSRVAMKEGRVMRVLRLWAAR